MNADYIYAIFDTCKQEDLPDLTIAQAYLQTKSPIPDGLTEQQINQFMGRHYDVLVEAYRTGDVDTFRATVAACDRDDSTNEVEA